MFLLIVFSLLADAIAIIAGASLMIKKSGAESLAKYATPFAAGGLLAAAFVDLLPEAADEGNIKTASLAILIGILAFFLLERAVHWFHHHSDHNDAPADKTATVPLIIIGNLLHRAIDGVAVAAGFLVSVPAGIIVTAAICAHEIPHTIGDFGLLLSKKVSRRNVLLINIGVALLTTLFAAITFVLGQNLALPLDILLGLTAGFFIYIAVSDIIPDIHEKEAQKFVGWQSVLLLLGAALVGALIFYLEQAFGSI